MEEEQKTPLPEEPAKPTTDEQDQKESTLDESKNTDSKTANPTSSVIQNDSEEVKQPQAGR